MFPDLFKMCEHKDISVFQAKNGMQQITFSRWPIDDMRNI